MSNRILYTGCRCGGECSKCAAAEAAQKRIDAAIDKWAAHEEDVRRNLCNSVLFIHHLPDRVVMDAVELLEATAAAAPVKT